jgi:hypothetical protein
MVQAKDVKAIEEQHSAPPMTICQEQHHRWMLVLTLQWQEVAVLGTLLRH